MTLTICAVLLVVFSGIASAEIIGGGDATTSEDVTPKRVKGVGDVVFSFTGPDNGAAGLTWDGTNLWLADAWSGNIYKIDPSDGSVISSFAAPTNYPTGLAWDGTNLWVVCEQAATAYKLDPSDGSVISSIHLPGYGEPDPNSACITWDGDYLWHADYTHNTIYKLEPSDGSVVSSFASPGSGPSGLTWDGTYLWHSDFATDTIYKLDPSDGSVVLSFASPASHPWDLAWDGAYLWNADHPSNTVYKIDVGVTDDDGTFSFSVLGTGDYITSSDLNNWDADLTYIIAELLGDVDQNERDAAVEPNDFYDEDAGADPPGADVSDLLYFTGHGSTGKVWLCDGTKEYSLDYNDIEANSDGWDLDLEWALFATCSTLEDDNWKVVLQHGAHTLCGYDDVTLDIVDTYVAYLFFYLTAGYRLPIVDSWKYANLLVGEGDWKCIFHEGNRNDHLWGFGSVGQDYLGTGDIIIYKTASQKPATTFNENLTSIIELAKLSDEKEVIPSLISVTPSSREIKETFNYFECNGKRIKEMEFRDEKAYYATDDAHTVILYPSGATIYFASDSDSKGENSGISISKQKAIAIAEKFIEEHGGLPTDSYLKNVLPVVQLKDGSTSVDGFIVKYGRKYDDMKVCGYAGDGMVVEVGANGNVQYFYKLWRNIAGTSGRNYVTISAKECLEKALPQIQQLIKGDRYTISNMELVYYSELFNKEQREIIPAWKIDIADTQGRADDYVFVDAASGKLIIP